MFRRSHTHAAPFALLLSLTASGAFAQAQPARPPAAAPAPAAAPTPTTAPTPAAAPAPAPPAQAPVSSTSVAAPMGTTGPDMSKVTEDLNAKLQAMQGTPNGLTADEAARRTLLNNPDVVAKQKSIAAADATRDETKARFYPKLDLTARYTRLSNLEVLCLPLQGPNLPCVPSTSFFPIILNNYNLQATLTIPLSDYVLRLSNSMASANHSKAAAQLDERATRLSVDRDARVAYYQWIRAQGGAYVAAKALESAQGHQQDAKNAFDAGLVSRADVLRTVSQEKSAELAVARAANNVAIATEQLRVFMVDTSQTNYEIGENILDELPPYALPPSPDAGYAEALERRLEMRQLGESEASLRAEAAVARAGNYPRLFAQGNGVYANPNTRYVPPDEKWRASWDASLILTWTPTDIFGATAQAKTAEAHADEVAARKNSLRNALHMEVSQALNGLAEATFGLSVSRDNLTAADENYRVRRELYRAGKATIVEVTDAETELTRARLEVVNSHVDVRIARVALTHALGRDVGNESK
ncbi:MAG TPA: TolC family protein [Polyangiaceae bacterium]|nr:TolC family protein [Polyangiaceae bacterium]